MEVNLTHNFGMDLVRVTESTALTAGRWMGRGQREEADRQATKAMYHAINTLDIDGHIVIGEETRLGDDSPLSRGQRVGTGRGPQVDVVLDPVDGVNLLVNSRPDAISVAAIAPRGTMWAPYPAVYMYKIVVDRETAPHLVPECMDAPVAWTLGLIARAKRKHVRDLVVFVLERPRHQELIEEIRVAGARVLIRSDGDIAGALMAASTHIDVDVMMSIGGIAEGVIAACAIKGLRGGMLGRLAPQSEAEKAAILEAGLDPGQILSCDELVRSDEVFFAATGITDGKLLSGVHYASEHIRMESIALHSETGAVRVVQTAYLVSW